MNAVTVILRDFIWPIIAGTAVIWAPLLLGWLSFGWWLEYVRKVKVSEAKWTMIEIKIPKEVYKSPAAMEAILTSMYADTKPPFFMPIGEQTKWYSIFVDFPKWFSAVWLGIWPLWRSLEIVSIEGNIYFFIRCETKHREMIENLIYAQFPQAEVTEVEDYTRFVPTFKQGNGWELRGTEFKLKNPDILPLKTYIDYGLHESFQLEEEQKIDPMVPLFQVLGSLGVGEQAWIQIIIQGSWAHFENPTKDPKKKAEKPFLTWTEWGKVYLDDLINKYAQETVQKKGNGADIKDTTIMTGGFRNLPEYEKPRVEAITRAIAKPGYDCAMRAIYLARTEHFDGEKLGEIQSAFKQVNAPEMNVLEAVNETDGGYFAVPFHDYKNLRKSYNREKIFRRYIKRDAFYPREMTATVLLKDLHDLPITRGTLESVNRFVLNTEELATLFHFPGSVAQTSALTRVEAQKAEPPANLPI